MTKKRYNNNSISFKDWTTKHLKEMALMYDDMIHGQNPCYGSSDLKNLDGILRELQTRHIDFDHRLSFI